MNATTAPPKNLSSTSLVGTTVVNAEGENLGKIEDLMIDMSAGRVAYAVLSFGGFLNMGNKLFALPFSALQCDCENESLTLAVQKEQLENASGFDKDDWPDTLDGEWGESLHKHYGMQPYWREN